MTANPRAHKTEVQHHGRGACTAILLLAALVGGSSGPGCRSNTSVPSIWPPADFRIEVQVFEVHADGSEHTQRFEVDAEGSALYRESRGDLDGAPLRVPVFSTVAAYELDRRSLRTLARMLHRTGLFDTDGGRSSNTSDRGAQLTVIWTAFGARGSLSTLSADIGPLERAVQVIDAFLPTSRTLRWPRERSESPLEPRVEETPDPIDYLPGSVAVHTEVARQRATEPWPLLELFAVAIEAGDFEIAEDALITLTALPDDWERSEFELTEWRRGVVAPLQRLFARRRAAAKR